MLLILLQLQIINNVIFLVIRPRELQLRKIKSDPVALYHQYQAEWKKMKFPGEDARSQLRWAIRQKMIGGDTIQERVKK